MKRFGYMITGDCNAYTASANAYQKVILAAECLHADLIVPEGCRAFVPKALEHYDRIKECLSPETYREYDGLLFPVSNEITILKAIKLSFIAPVVLFCWDPPGVSRRDENALTSRLRCWLMDRLLSLAILRSEGLIMNLHPGFSNRFGRRVRQKIYYFQNGTNVKFNHDCAEGVVRERRRIAVNGTFSASKGCWYVAELFVRLWRDDHSTTLMWVGYGDQQEDVKKYFEEHGIPRTAFTLGPMKHKDALRALAASSLAVCLYNDVPSLRWNYILKAPEFLSLGLPIVASDLPGVGAYVTPGETGWLCDPNDAEGCFAVVKRALDDECQLDRMRASASDAAKQYDWRTINEAIANTIQELVS